MVLAFALCDLHAGQRQAQYLKQTFLKSEWNDLFYKNEVWKQYCACY